MKQIFFITVMLFSLGLLWSQTAGHEHDLEREAMLQALFAISWPHTNGIQSATILTATTPASLLLWADGAAIIMDAKELMDAGLNLSKNSGSGLYFDKNRNQIVITKNDLSTINQQFKYKEAIFAEFLILNAEMIDYDRDNQRVMVDLGQASASWPVEMHEHHDHDNEEEGHQHHGEEGHHHHGEDDYLLGRQFWSSRQPLKPNQKERLGHAKPKLRLQIIINAKPLIKAGLNPKQLRTMRYEVEHYGWFNLFKRERIIVDYYF